MASRRLASLTPAAETATQLATSELTCVASVIVTNTSSTPAEVTVVVKPVDNLGAETKFSYLASNLPITDGQTFETFRFPLTVGDIVEVTATTNSVNFTLVAVFDNQGGQNVLYTDQQPLYPNVGDIWVNSLTENVSVWTGDAWNSIAINAPAGPQGDAGPTGPTGPDGLPQFAFNLLGSVATVADLPAFGNLGTGVIGTPSEPGDGLAAYSDAYYVDSVARIYVWTETGWGDVGFLQGPTGPIAINLKIQGSVASFTELPSDLPTPDPEADIQREAYYVQDEDVYYAWTGTEWINVGNFAGDTGPQGPTGPTGDTGPQGLSLTIKGEVATIQELPTDAAIGDAYQVLGLSEVEDPTLEVVGLFLWTGTEWQDITIFQGPTGPAGLEGVAGPVGPSAYEIAVEEGFTGTRAQWLETLVVDPGFAYSFQGEVATFADLPSDTLLNEEGDAYLVADSGDVYVWAGEVWVNFGALVGPAGPAGDTGPAGPQGDPGADGASGPIGITWQGTWDSATSYAENDGVQYQGSSYIAVVPAPVVGTAPDGSAEWDLVAQKGLDGTGSGSTIEVTATSDPTTFVGLYEDATGTIGGKTNTGITYDATNEVLTVTSIETGSIQAPTGLTGTYSIVSPTTITLNATDEILNTAPIRLVNKTAADLTTLTASIGSVVFNTDDNFAYYYNGTSWVNLEGPAGPAGPAGADGADGADGAAATVAVGTTTTGAAGTSASVTNSGTTSAAVFDFTIPQGADGATGATGPAGPAINAIATLDVVSNGSTSYRFVSHYGSTDNPDVYAIGGATLAFDLTNVSSLHPFLIRENGTNISTGIIHVATDGTVTEGSGAQGQTSGTVYWEVPITSASSWDYICSVHTAMNGNLIIKSLTTI